MKQLKKIEYLKHYYCGSGCTCITEDTIVNKLNEVVKQVNKLIDNTLKIDSDLHPDNRSPL